MNRTAVISLHGPSNLNSTFLVKLLAEALEIACKMLKRGGLGPEPWLVTYDDDRSSSTYQQEQVLPVPVSGTLFEGCVPGEPHASIGLSFRTLKAANAVMAFERTETVSVDGQDADKLVSLYLASLNTQDGYYESLSEEERTRHRTAMQDAMGELARDQMIEGLEATVEAHVRAPKLGTVLDTDGVDAEMVMATMNARSVTRPVMKALELNPDTWQSDDKMEEAKAEIRRLWLKVLAHDAELSQEMRERIWMDADFSTRSILQYLTYSHLRDPEVQKISMRFCNLAYNLCRIIHPSPERTKMLDEIRQGKDRAVTAYLDKVSRKTSLTVTSLVRLAPHVEQTMSDRQKALQEGRIIRTKEDALPWVVRWDDGTESAHSTRDLVEVVRVV